jgi:lipoate-protein ligase A
VHLALKAAGARTRLWSEPSGPGPAAGCFPRPTTADLVAEDGTKLLGGALRRRRGVGLYQGSLRLSGDWGAVAADGIAAKWKIRFKPCAPAPAELAAARLLDSKYRSDAWNLRR